MADEPMSGRLTTARFVTIGGYWRSPSMNRTERLDHTPIFISALLVGAAAVTLAGCGATTTWISSGAVAAAAPILTPAATASPDVVAARAAALTIYYAVAGQTPEW